MSGRDLEGVGMTTESEGLFLERAALTHHPDARLSESNLPRDECDERRSERGEGIGRRGRREVERGGVQRSEVKKG